MVYFIIACNGSLRLPPSPGETIPNSTAPMSYSENGEEVESLPSDDGEVKQANVMEAELLVSSSSSSEIVDWIWKPLVVVGSPSSTSPTKWWWSTEPPVVVLTPECIMMSVEKPRVCRIDDDIEAVPLLRMDFCCCCWMKEEEEVEEEREGA